MAKKAKGKTKQVKQAKNVGKAAAQSGKQAGKKAVEEIAKTSTTAATIKAATFDAQAVRKEFTILRGLIKKLADDKNALAALSAFASGYFVSGKASTNREMQANWTAAAKASPEAKAAFSYRGSAIQAAVQELANLQKRSATVSGALLKGHDAFFAALPKTAQKAKTRRPAKKS